MLLKNFFCRHRDFLLELTFFWESYLILEEQFGALPCLRQAISFSCWTHWRRVSCFWSLFERAFKLDLICDEIKLELFRGLYGEIERSAVFPFQSLLQCLFLSHHFLQLLVFSEESERKREEWGQTLKWVVREYWVFQELEATSKQPTFFSLHFSICVFIPMRQARMFDGQRFTRTFLKSIRSGRYPLIHTHFFITSKRKREKKPPQREKKKQFQRTI